MYQNEYSINLYNMEANLEAYLAKKGINYEKSIYNNPHYPNQIAIDYVLDKFVIFEDDFDFMKITHKYEELRGQNAELNKFKDDLDKNSYNYKQVLQVVNKCLYTDIQLNINDIIFRVEYYDIELIPNLYEFVKFITYNTILKINDYDQYIAANNYRILCDDKIQVFEVNSEQKYEFISLTEFIDWFTITLPEFLKNNDIKIALK